MSSRSTESTPKEAATRRTGAPAAAARASALADRYRPSEHECAVRKAWEESSAFHADPQRVLSGEKPPYCIFIPPPNVTARLHLGHALNNTLQDILARAHRMKGFEVLWMPGTDHAGIATQAIVEQRLRKEGKIKGPLREAMTREQFVTQVQAWKDEYEAAITEQLKVLGCSCDWARQRFTMDEICTRAVREAFFRLFKDGLIYRGKRLVNWDPVTQTALADDEVEMEEVDGHFYYLRYPLVHGPQNPTPVTWSELARRGYPGADRHPPEQQACVTVATTRPETYLGDTAIGVNPRDPRAGALRGLAAQLPLVGRIIPIIEDEYVVMPAPDPHAEGVDPKSKYATGFLKVTPAHDTNDYEIGLRHKLSIVNVFAPDATISDKHGWSDVGDARIYLGLSRETAREKVVAEFKARGLLEKTLPYRHSVGHSYRSHVAIEPYLSDQWYCKVADERMRGSALRAMAAEQRREGTEASRHQVIGASGDGALKFFPDRYAKTYESWHENLRDWCISRQLWWGHRIPIWSGLQTRMKSDSMWNLVEGFAPRGDTTAEGETGRGSRLVEPGRSFEQVGFDHATKDVWSYICVRPESESAESSLEAAGYVRDPDVLDTWFSSALWPMSTLGWPEPPPEMKGLLEAFNPSSVLCTAREIITLWVSRMVMFNRYLMPEENGLEGGTKAPAAAGELRHRGTTEYADPESSGRGGGPVPFRHVYINPVVQDGHGQRMSKSLGNGVDPIDIVESHGADALRLVMCQTATSTQDVRMPVDLICPHCSTPFEPAWTRSPAGYTVAAPEQKCPKCGKSSISPYGAATASAKPSAERPLARNSSTRFDAGRNFCTKLWNAARFTLMNLEGGVQGGEVTPSGLSLVDRWMLSRLARTVQAINESLTAYEFSVYAGQVYDVFWRDFCDWYLEAIKPTVRANADQRAVLREVFTSILRLMHPILPHITEVLHGALASVPRGRIAGLDAGRDDPSGVLARSGWPIGSASLIDEKAERDFAQLRALVDAIRLARSGNNVDPRRRPTLHADTAVLGVANRSPGVVEALAGLGAITTEPKPDGAASFLLAGHSLSLSNIADAADPRAERALLEASLSKLEKDIGAMRSRLDNPGYTDKAPAHLVEETRRTLANKEAERDAAAARLRALG